MFSWLKLLIQLSVFLTWGVLILTERLQSDRETKDQPLLERRNTLFFAYKNRSHDITQGEVSNMSVWYWIPVTTWTTSFLFHAAAALPIVRKGSYSKKEGAGEGGWTSVKVISLHIAVTDWGARNEWGKTWMGGRHNQNIPLALCQYVCTYCIF